LPSLKQAADELEALLGQFDAQARRQHALSGASLEKAIALQTLGDLAHEIANAVRACAVASGNPDLLGQVGYGRADWSRGADKVIIGRAQNLHATAFSVLDSLAEYGVTAAKLATLQERIDGFRQVHPAPRQRVATSSAATKEIRDLLTEAGVLLKERIDRLMVQFKAAAPEFYNAYSTARAVVGPPTRSATPASETVATPVAKAA
jgi:hypothetical protein